MKVDLFLVEQKYTNSAQQESSLFLREYSTFTYTETTLNSFFCVEFLQVSVSYFTSASRQNEFETNSDSVIPLFSITYFLAINISILSCLRYHRTLHNLCQSQVNK